MDACCFCINLGNKHYIIAEDSIIEVLAIHVNTNELTVQIIEGGPIQPLTTTSSPVKKRKKEKNHIKNCIKS